MPFNVTVGAEAYDEHVSKANAAKNFIVLAYGAPKAGKTHFAMQSQRPLYVAYLDTNPNLETHLLKSAPEWGDEIYKLVLKPMNYDDLTEAEAVGRITKLEEFAAEAKRYAKERRAQGLHGGTFILDGALYLKGYFEKALLGESATLGYRAKRGERGGPSTFDYAKSNAALFDFVSGFANEDLDFIAIFEGRPIYSKGLDARGNEISTKTDKWRSTRPDRIPFAVNAEIELLKTLERQDPSNNQSPLMSTPKLRVVLNSENYMFDHMVFPAMGFQRFKEMMLAPVVGDVVMQHESEVIRANDSGLGGEDE